MSHVPYKHTVYTDVTNLDIALLHTTIGTKSEKRFVGTLDLAAAFLVCFSPSKTFLGDNWSLDLNYQSYLKVL